MVGDLPTAITRAREALALASRSLPPHHDQRIWLLTNLAGFYQQTGDFANQLPIFQELLAIHDRHPIGVGLDELLYNIGDALCHLDRCAEGTDAFTRLLARPLQGHKRAFPLVGLAYVHLAAGAPDLALQRLEQAYPLVQAAPDAPPGLVLDVTRLLARSLTALGRDRKRVRRLEAEAAALAVKIAAEP
jgi:tetratricopeptide (TPR) repeat protein